MNERMRGYIRMEWDGMGWDGFREGERKKERGRGMRSSISVLIII